MGLTSLARLRLLPGAGKGRRAAVDDRAGDEAKDSGGGVRLQQLPDSQSLPMQPPERLEGPVSGEACVLDVSPSTSLRASSASGNTSFTAGSLANGGCATADATDVSFSSSIVSGMPEAAALPPPAASAEPRVYGLEALNVEHAQSPKGRLGSSPERSGSSGGERNNRNSSPREPPRQRPFRARLNSDASVQSLASMTHSLDASRLYANMQATPQKNVPRKKSAFFAKAQLTAEAHPTTQPGLKRSQSMASFSGSKSGRKRSMAYVKAPDKDLDWFSGMRFATLNAASNAAEKARLNAKSITFGSSSRKAQSPDGTIRREGLRERRGTEVTNATVGTIAPRRESRIDRRKSSRYVHGSSEAGEGLAQRRGSRVNMMQISQAAEAALGSEDTASRMSKRKASRIAGLAAANAHSAAIEALNAPKIRPMASEHAFIMRAMPELARMPTLDAQYAATSAFESVPYKAGRSVLDSGTFHDSFYIVKSVRRPAPSRPCPARHAH